MSKRGQSSAATADAHPPARRVGAKPNLRCHRVRTGRVRYGAASGFGVDHGDGDDLAAWLARQSALRNHQPGFLLLSLMLDGVLLAHDLELAWAALGSAYRIRDGVCVEWIDASGRQQRRLLGSVTAISLARQPRRAPFADAQAELPKAIDESGLLVHERSDQRPELTEVSSVVRARLATALPGDLFAHCNGDQPLTAVPRSCLARRQVQMALTTATAEGVARTPDNMQLQVADAAIQTSGADAGRMRWLAAKLVESCKADASVRNDTAMRRSMLGALQSIAADFVAVGGSACVLWGWCHQLVRHGTRRKSPLDPDTIDPYVGLAAPRLAPTIGQLVRDEWTSHPWSRMYAAALADPTVPQTRLGKLAAALTSFHEYLEEYYDVAPFGRALAADVPARLPRANIVWPHEQAWMIDRIDATATGRFGQQLACIAAIACAAGVRSEDAWLIHVSGVTLADDTVVVYVDPLPTDGPGKSRNSRRYLELRDPRACEHLRRWVQRRLDEGALPRDLLFGDPASPRTPYRQGATERMLSAWLKAATGDATVSLHTLRHSFVSLAREELRDGEQRRIDEASAQAAHGSTQVSFVHYAHLYELPLRRALHVWRRNVDLTEARACGLAGAKPGMLRQAWRRHPLVSRRVQAWKVIDSAAQRCEFPAVEQGIALSAPMPLHSASQPAWTPYTVCVWLSDMAAGVDEAMLLTRHDIGSASWAQLQRALRDGGLGRTGPGRRTSLPRTPTRPLPFADGFTRVDQPKLAPLVSAMRRETNRESLAPVVQSWSDCLAGDFLDLREPNDALPMLRWMHSAGIEASQLVLCHCFEPGAAAEEVTDVVDLVFGAPPQWRRAQPRAGRPAV